jgi:hypothetical protein
MSLSKEQRRGVTLTNYKSQMKKTLILPMFARKKEMYNHHPSIKSKEIKVVTKLK